MEKTKAITKNEGKSFNITSNIEYQFIEHQFYHFIQGIIIESVAWDKQCDPLFTREMLIGTSKGTPFV